MKGRRKPSKKLCGLVPSARVNLGRSHGVLGPVARLRPAIVAQAVADATQAGVSAARVLRHLDLATAPPALAPARAPPRDDDPAFTS
jgi:hypothetical protein